MSYAASFKLFSESTFFGFQNEQRLKITREIESETENYILNVSETEYVNSLIDKYVLEPIIFHFEQVAIEHFNVNRKVSEMPNAGLYFNQNAQVQELNINFFFPFEGNDILFKLQPSSYYLRTEPAKLNGNELIIQFRVPEQNQEVIMRKLEELKTFLSDMSGNINIDVNSFNSMVRNHIPSTFTSRKNKILGTQNLIANLGIPLKKKENLSPTFSVPVSKKKVSVIKPSAPTTPYVPEPTLVNENYNEILKIIYDMGKQMERTPSVYEGLGEEALRDRFLFILQSHYNSSSVTGETFNKGGKTDILIRYENSNLFVGECKFWTGKKGYIKTIDQLLGYLTWRDSKAAVIMFVDNKEISPILEHIVELTQGHPNYLDYKGHIGEGWYQFKFHLAEDANKEFDLAIMLYHFPK